MAALLKEGQRVALKFEGNGPVGKIIVEAESSGHVRGYVSNPWVEIEPREGKLDVAGAVGKSGTLLVIKDLGLRDPYNGMVPLYSGEVAEDLAYYFTESEQIPSAVGLGVFVNNEGLVRAAGGFLLQSFPPRNHRLIEKLVQKIEKMPTVTEILREGKGPSDILNIIFQGIPYDLLEEKEIAFKCNCSRERVEAALISLGMEELERLVVEEGGAQVKCEFCKALYEFDEKDLKALQDEVIRKVH